MNATTQSLSAAQNGRVYTEGERNQGPVVIYFPDRKVTKQHNPGTPREWPIYTDGPSPEILAEEQLFDHGRVAGIVTTDAIEGTLRIP